MTPALALLIIGAVLVRSGYLGQSIVDAFKGAPAPQGSGGTGDASSASGPLESGNTPAGLTTMDGHLVAAWIATILHWARQNGWHGKVTSGYRSKAQQTILWNTRASNPNPVAPPGNSNHEKVNYPGGAVDVSNPAELNTVLKGYPGHPNLVWGGTTIEDAVHFSATGH